jgi:hypothetical protein
MARALSTQVKEFLDMWLAPQKGNQLLLDYYIEYTKCPYVHDGKFSRKYEYRVKDGFELVTKTPYDMDLMGFPEVKVHTKSILKTLNGSDCESLNKYKQIVLHYQTYTGIVKLDSGTENVVLEIHIKNEMQ